VDFEVFGGDIYGLVEIIPPPFSLNLHHFGLDFELGFRLVEMVEIVEVFPINYRVRVQPATF
jgi:hypothetical protein